MDDLDTSAADRFTSIARQLSAIAPGIGPVCGELVTVMVPRQRQDRIVDFVRALQHQIDVLRARVDVFESNAKTEYGSAIMEDGLVQAARTVGVERREHIATLVVRSLTEEELDYERTKKLLNIYSELTYPEVVTLIYRSMHPTLGDGSHVAFYERHEAILAPVRDRIGDDQSVRDRLALQESYRDTLVRLGLATEIERDNTHMSRADRRVLAQACAR